MSIYICIRAARCCACSPGIADVCLNCWRALNRISMADVVQNGRSYGGGLHKVEPKELMAMPLLYPPDWLRNLNEKQLALIA
jgi:hypothetical protein